MTKANYEVVADEIYRLRELKQRALVENAEGEEKRQQIIEMAEFLGFSPFLSVKAEVIKRKSKDKTISRCRQSISIPIENTFISGWLYLPEDIVNPVSCVILSNGFCGTKDAVLEDYALRFIDAGGQKVIPE